MSYSRIEVVPAFATMPSNAPSQNSSKAQERVSYQLLQDETELLKIYRKAKRMGYADISVTIQEGTRVKLWLTEKIK